MLYILTGQSAAGKDYIFKLMKKYYLAQPVVTATTRPPREHEINHVDYHFLSRDEFAQGIQANKFLEYTSYKTCVKGITDEWFYGTPENAIDGTINQVIVLNPAGMRDLLTRQKTLGIETKVIYVDCPTSIREQRAMKRGSFDKQEWDRRLQYDEIDFRTIETYADVIFDNSAEISEDMLLERIKKEIIGVTPGSPTDAHITPMMITRIETLLDAATNVRDNVYDDGLSDGTDGILIECDTLIKKIQAFLRK